MCYDDLVFNRTPETVTMSKKVRPQKKAAGKNAAPSAPPRRTAPVPAAAAEPAPRYAGPVLGLILAASLALGVVAVMQFRSSPYFNYPIIDERSLVEWARAIAGGAIVGDRVFYQDPLYPYLLAAVFRLGGENFLLVRLLQVVMGVASVGAVYVLGARIGGARCGLAGAAALALYRGLYFFELQLLKETLVILLSALACVLGAETVKAPERWRRSLAFGLSLGLLALVRGNFLLLLPLFAAAMFFLRRQDPGWRRLARAGAVAAGIGIVLAPVALRNYAVGGRLVLTTSQGGANFYLGNCEYADGRYVRLPFVRSNPEFEAADFQAEAERRLGRSLSPSEVSRFWFKQGLSWIAAHPGRALGLLVHKTHLLLHQYEVADNHNFYALREIFVPALWAPLIGFGALWAAALLGGWEYRRQPQARFAMLFIALYALSILPFFIVDRYRLVLVPALAALAGCGLVRLGQLARVKAWSGLAWRAGLAGAALTIAVLPIRESRQPLNQDYQVLAQVYLQQGELDLAWAWYQRAATNLPADATALRDDIIEGQAATDELRDLMAEAGREQDPDRLVARARELLGQWDQPQLALKVLQRALTLDPDSFPANFDLGRLYLYDPQVRDLHLALKYLHRGLDLKPLDPEVRAQIAAVHDALGQGDQACRWRQETGGRP
jgi:4-amino-4-deoxy-L-arabinose transferase-like glycosyltransferase